MPIARRRRQLLFVQITTPFLDSRNSGAEIFSRRHIVIGWLRVFRVSNGMDETSALLRSVGRQSGSGGPRSGDEARTFAINAAASYGWYGFSRKGTKC
jgi:hypothetical protein